MSKLILNKIKNNTSVNNYDLLKAKYGLDVLRNDGNKIIILLLFYLLLSQVKIYLFCLIILIPIRRYTGGLHLKSNKACFCFTFCFFWLAIFILPKLPFPNKNYIFILLFSEIMLISFPPIISTKKAFLTPNTVRYLRRKGQIVCLIFGILLFCITTKQLLFHCGTWIIFLQALQLFIAHVKRRIRI